MVYRGTNLARHLEQIHHSPIHPHISNYPNQFEPENILGSITGTFISSSSLIFELNATPSAKMNHKAFFVLTVLSLTGVSISAPTRVTTSSSSYAAAATHVAPSTCTTYYPSVLRQLDESAPNVKLANTAKDKKAFHVAQSVSFTDNVKFDRVHQYVVFDNIASGSWDCQLMVSWFVSLLSAKPCV